MLNKEMKKKERTHPELNTLGGYRCRRKERLVFRGPIVPLIFHSDIVFRRNDSDDLDAVLVFHPNTAHHEIPFIKRIVGNKIGSKASWADVEIRTDQISANIVIVFDRRLLKLCPIHQRSEEAVDALLDEFMNADKALAAPSRIDPDGQEHVEPNILSVLCKL